MPLKIREAIPEDSQTISDFIMELAIYEKLSNAVKITVEKYSNHIAYFSAKLWKNIQSN